MRRWREAARARGLLVIAIAAAGLFAALGVAGAPAADELAVDVVNTSEPTLCAEHDNVTLELASEKVRRLGIEAALERSARDQVANCIVSSLKSRGMGL